MLLKYQALRELKRQREKDAALQIEKQRSRETEMAFFKSETAAGKSLNSILMQNSLQAGRPPQVSSDSTFASGFVQCKKVNFAEVCRTSDLLCFFLLMSVSCVFLLKDGKFSEVAACRCCFFSGREIICHTDTAIRSRGRNVSANSNRKQSQGWH